MEPDNGTAQDLLSDLAATRRRAQRVWMADVLCAALAAVVCAGGAVVFALEADIAGTEFDGWAYWLIALGVAGTIVVVVRHFRGVHRASASRLAGRVLTLFVLLNVAALFSGYAWGSVGAQMPFVFPAAAAAAVAILALRRHELAFAGVLFAVGAAIIVVGMRTQVAAGPVWWFSNNLGYAASSAMVAVASLVAGVRWYRRDSA